MSVAFTLWRDGLTTSEVLVEAATQALVDGLDSPSLRELAGVLPSEAPYAAPELCERALEELGLKPADGHAARVALVRDHARQILSGDIREFAGARAVWWTFSATGDYPEVTTEMLSLEDEWEGGWGRTEDEIRGAIRNHAARILDVWGDPVSPIHRLHSAARSWLIDEHTKWAERYAGLAADGGDRIERIGGAWDYTGDARRMFPRYIVVEYILREVESAAPSDFADLPTLRDHLRAAALRGFETSHVRNDPAANEEVGQFLDWIDTTRSEAWSPVLMPYRRTLSAAEEDHWRRELEQRWGVTDGLSHPMLSREIPQDVVVIDSGVWNRPEAVEALRAVLKRHDVSVVVSIHELEPSAEMAVEIFDPSYGSPGEILATSTHPWWLLYTSHEGTTAFTPGPHIESLRREIQDWDLWQTHPS